MSSQKRICNVEEIEDSEESINEKIRTDNRGLRMEQYIDISDPEEESDEVEERDETIIQCQSDSENMNEQVRRNNVALKMEQYIDISDSEEEDDELVRSVINACDEYTHKMRDFEKKKEKTVLRKKISTFRTVQIAAARRVREDPTAKNDLLKELQKQKEEMHGEMSGAEKGVLLLENLDVSEGEEVAAAGELRDLIRNAQPYKSTFRWVNRRLNNHGMYFVTKNRRVTFQDHHQ